jgi:hypothetical protein
LADKDPKDILLKVRVTIRKPTEMRVCFTHVGTMSLEDITHHTIPINRRAGELKGKYDGWETSVERQQV